MLATPLMTGPDEVYQARRAAAVVRGQLTGNETSLSPLLVEVKVPESYRRADEVERCFLGDLVEGVPQEGMKLPPSDCPPFGGSDRIVGANTGQYRGQPFFYALVGLPTLIDSGAAGVPHAAHWCGRHNGAAGLCDGLGSPKPTVPLGMAGAVRHRDPDDDVSVGLDQPERRRDRRRPRSLGHGHAACAKRRRVHPPGGRQVRHGPHRPHRGARTRPRLRRAAARPALGDGRQIQDGAPRSTGRRVGLGGRGRGDDRRLSRLALDDPARLPAPRPPRIGLGHRRQLSALLPAPIGRRVWPERQRYPNSPFGHGW